MDKKTQIFEEMGHEWRNIAGVSAIDAAQLIMMDGIDILVELSGHSDGNRLDVMALKPAPILVTWIGYPNTTGLPTIDYRISDAIADPVNSQQKYSERIVRLPSAFLCYTPLEEVPSVSVSPADINGYTTYGSFNNLVKVNERVMDVWCSVLLRQPTSRMVIKCKPFGSDMIKEKTYRRFQARGIARHRIDLLPLTPTTKEHLQVPCTVCGVRCVVCSV